MNKKNLIRFISNIPGWKTKRRIVVIESDDWGSTRFPDIETVNIFKQEGYNIDKCGFSRYDCLETNKDLESLIQMLKRLSEKHDKKICLTMLCNTSNSNFELIEKSNFTQYFGEILSDLISEDSKRDKIINLLKKGRNLGYFDLQYHGREHLNVNRWMRALQEKQQETLFAFQNKVGGISRSYMPNLKKGYRAAYDLDRLEDLVSQKKSLLTGLKEFKQLYSFYPSYFVAPNGPFHKDLEIELSKNGIGQIGMSKIQKMPIGNGNYKKRFNWLGKELKSGLTVITRNVIFEPLSRISGNVDTVINDIDIAFALNKPAIISTHRANYVGGIDQKNRESGLKKLNMLLSSIIKKWPDVEFMTSSELADLIREKNGRNS
jgi:hypothetical protein